MFFIEFEQPLSGKADIQILVSEKSLRNGRYALDSGRWDGKVVNDRK